MFSPSRIVKVVNMYFLWLGFVSQHLDECLQHLPRGGEGRVQVLISIIERQLLYLAKLTYELGAKTQNESSKLEFGMNQQAI